MGGNPTGVLESNSRGGSLEPWFRPSLPAAWRVTGKWSCSCQQRQSADITLCDITLLTTWLWRKLPPECACGGERVCVRLCAYVGLCVCVCVCAYGCTCASACVCVREGDHMQAEQTPAGQGVGDLGDAHRRGDGKRTEADRCHTAQGGCMACDPRVHNTHVPQSLAQHSFHPLLSSSPPPHRSAALFRLPSCLGSC